MAIVAIGPGDGGGGGGVGGCGGGWGGDDINGGGGNGDGGGGGRGGDGDFDGSSGTGGNGWELGPGSANDRSPPKIEGVEGVDGCGVSIDVEGRGVILSAFGVGGFGRKNRCSTGSLVS